MDLFEQSPLRHEHAPLAVRMRPESLEEYVGQEHILGPGKLLRRAISEDILRSLILYGPPGSGKTTLGYVISRTTKGVFVNVSATTTGAAELKRLAEEARDRRAFHGQRTILFVDEIQRLNKAQQDVLLPAVEKGDLILIGATTENPYFEVNAALLSRSQIYQLQPLEEEHLLTLARRALEDPRGLGDVPCQVSQEALRHLARIANGDARVLLNNLEFAVLTTLPNEAGVRLVDLAVAEEAAQAQRVRYDKAGDQHYDVISAFIKSLRGSDPDAALYWYARMVYAGEDPRFVVRRLLVHAAEDVGMADPTALLMAQAAGFALEWLGMPEARIPIAQAIIYIATAPKSNSVIKAVDAALAAVEKTGAEPVPVHLRDTHYAGAAKLGHGRGYRYPHDYPHHYVVQEYLPENMKGFRVYEPSEQGREKVIKERLAYFAKLKEAHQRQEP
ncbi:MAG: replication-associated recombination protein A [Limnochordia bacterium]|jgi:putative ATPase|nr:replication-associated recombination protein A [Limnochordia bacterium]MDI9465118.1 replication-associated recombination protein A [Bacillota bacterium]NLO95812.1 replication-associated recombination protein A [Bacillota bacterium]HOB40886.1 replication-associated recombination protein A [Limnochordia bacterium]HOK31190.1 replication-associated recombination protein A [Limnochordia bacterium]